MIGVLAAMARKGEPMPASLKSYGTDPANGYWIYSRIHSLVWLDGNQRAGAYQKH